MDYVPDLMQKVNKIIDKNMDSNQNENKKNQENNQDAPKVEIKYDTKITPDEYLEDE